MLCPTITHIPNGVDCHKQVRSWRLLRSVIQLLIPTCNRTFIEHESYFQTYHPKPVYTTFSRVITGTIFGYRKGKLSFCIQATSKSINPILILEFVVPSVVLAREMQGGILRIGLDFTGSGNCSTMYCNGRKVGYAAKRRPTKDDVDALRLTSSIVVGAGIISGKELDNDDDFMYLRANFERLRGLSVTESFHLIDPDRNIGQELSIYIFRSR